MNSGGGEHRLRILYLEDNPLDCELVAAALKADRLACDILQVNTKEAFQEALKRNELDLILSDFSLPSFNGMSALTMAKSMAAEAPFIFVSGTIGEERAVEGLKAGATDYVLKDRLQHLATAVRRALREAEERKRRREIEASLKESEARFRQVAENIDQVFWLTDTHKDEMLYISPAYERIWGRTRENLYRRPSEWLDAIHESDRPRILDAVRTKQNQGTYQETYRVVRPDSSIRWVLDRAYPIRNAAGEVYRIVGIAQDITDQRALQDQLRQSQKMEGFGQLAGGVAHDFNNLLTVMRGNAELLLLNSAQLSPEANECLKQIAAAAERAANLTRQLLAFSRKQVMQPKPVILNEVIGNLAKMLRRIIKEDIQLECHYEAKLPFVLADAGMLEQVLVNLVVNARDAMPQGGTLVIATELIVLDGPRLGGHPEARAGEFVCWSVSDTGTGISPEHLQRIFEPFFTTKEVGKGTGLGLATVYGIVKQHQGWIEVSSRLGEGATFKIFLPAVPAPDEVPGSFKAQPELRGGSESILLVEDDNPVRMVTRRVLESFGYNVLEAGSANDALKLWQTHQDRIALLLTDIVMPEGVTGRELADILRKQKPDIKVILMSGYSAEVAGKDAEFSRRSRNHFIQKPSSSRTLLDMVRRCLDEK